MRHRATFSPKARRFVAEPTHAPTRQSLFDVPTRASTARNKKLKAYVTSATHARFSTLAERQSKTVSALLNEIVVDFLDQQQVEERWLVAGVGEGRG